jgi:hypothetical protein
MDRRTQVAAKLTAAYNAIIDDCGGGSQVSHVKNAMIERFCFLQHVIEDLERQIANDPQHADQIIMGRWVQAVNSLSGLARNLGFGRRAKKVADLGSYLEAKKK